MLALRYLLWYYSYVWELISYEIGSWKMHNWHTRGVEMAFQNQVDAPEVVDILDQKSPEEWPTHIKTKLLQCNMLMKNDSTRTILKPF
jgi:hypothetical protein